MSVSACELVQRPMPKTVTHFCVCLLSAPDFVGFRQGWTYMPKRTSANSRFRMDSVAGSETEGGNLFFFFFFTIRERAGVYHCYEAENAIPRRTREKHNGGNKSGQRCRVLS